jgi:3-deoxy-D-manno-octulosonic-acid transferase
MAPPLDFWGAPGRFLDRLEPRALALIETELWPETLHQAARRRLPVIVAAGRLGRRSFERLGRVRGLFGPLLASLALIAAMTETDRERFVALGARPDRVVVLGSPKFDDLIAAARARLAGPVPEAPGESGGRASPTLVVAGSTHPGEEALILSALGDLSNTTLLLAPRHLERVSSTVALAAGRPVKLFSEIADLGSPALAGTVVVLDRLGVLIDLYARADLCLVGGSFLPGSGHNPLEPASQGRPVVFGPHMSSFEAQAEALAAQGAAWRCQPGELAALLARLTADPAALAAAGRAGLELVAGLEPVAPALARAIVRTLEAAEPAPGP